MGRSIFNRAAVLQGRCEIPKGRCEIPNHHGPGLVVDRIFPPWARIRTRNQRHEVEHGDVASVTPANEEKERKQYAPNTYNRTQYSP
jgi:hypothetical protein